MIIVAKSPFRYNKNQKIPARKLAGTGAGNVTRTRDLLITNQLLYRLSYSSKPYLVIRYISYSASRQEPPAAVARAHALCGECAD